MSIGAQVAISSLDGNYGHGRSNGESNCFKAFEQQDGVPKIERREDGVGVAYRKHALAAPSE
jgi:hypothetical protein